MEDISLPEFPGKAGRLVRSAFIISLDHRVRDSQAVKSSLAGSRYPIVMRSSGPETHDNHIRSQTSQRIAHAF